MGLRVRNYGILTADSADDLIPEIVNTLLESGDEVVIATGSNTGRTTIEIRDVVVRVKAQNGIMLSKTRGVSYKLIATEFLMYVCGWGSTPGECELLCKVAPKYESFLNPGTKKFDGFYGPHIQACSGSVLHLLKKDPGTRQAIIPIYESEDLYRAARGASKDIPCTTMMQFFVRGGCLHTSIYLRSSDAFWGLPHDMGAFSLMNRLFADILGLEPGDLTFHLGSVHLYSDMVEEVKKKVVPNDEKLDLCDPDIKGFTVGMYSQALTRILVKMREYYNATVSERKAIRDQHLTTLSEHEKIYNLPDFSLTSLYLMGIGRGIKNTR